MSSADLVALRYVAESTIGTTPTTPALKTLRYKSESLNYNLANVQSEEVRSTRVESDLVLVSANSAGDVNFELSYGTFDDFLEAVLGGTWTIGTGDQYDLDNGILRKSFTIQKHFQDMTTPQYHNYKGQVVDGMTLNMEVGKIVEGSFSFLGMGVTASGTQIAGATFPAASTTVPLNAVANLQNLTIGGVPYSGCIMSNRMEVRANARQRNCIGSTSPTDVKLGTLQISGDANFYFNESSNYDSFLNASYFSLSWQLVDAANNAYTFTLPRCRYETAQVVAGGRGSDVMFAAKWRALYDSVTGRVIRINRNPGP